MFEPNQYRELCSELHVSEEKLEEVIQMTEQEKKRKFHRPMRLGLVAAAVAAMLVVTVSAANSEAIMTYLTSLRDAAVAGEAWADSPVNTEEGTGGLRLPEASLEERDGRTILIVDGVETDVTQALTDQGEYLYECGEGEEQAQVRVYLDEQGEPRLMTSFFTAGEDGGTGAVVVVPAEGETPPQSRIGSLVRSGLLTQIILNVILLHGKNQAAQGIGPPGAVRIFD